MTKRKKKIWLTITGIIFALLLAGIVFLVYWRIEAVKAAIIRFVSIKTHGEYELEIGKSAIDFRNVDLDFSDVTLRRTHPEKKGVRSLHIPFVHIALSSYKVLLYPDSLEIDKLIIDEPIIEIEKGELKNTHHESLAGNLVKLYPASKEFLEHYRVHELSIRKGGFKLTKDKEDIVKVGLIDFYLSEWNVPFISERSQLQLTLGKQQIDYERSKIQFSEISYSFSQKYIRFSDFNFSTSDSLQHTAIEVSGKELLLDAIDYDQLMDFQRYKVKKIKVDYPKIKIKLTLTGNGKPGRKNNHDRIAITNMLKSAVGEFIVDSTLVKQANVELQVFRNTDSLKIELPKVDLDINDFIVLNDSSNFYMGGMSVSLPDTRIRLFNHLVLACDQFMLDRNSDISIGNVRIYPNEKDSAFVTCERIYFDNFNIPAFAFTRELKANAITLQAADITITPQLMQQIIRPSATHSARPSKSPLLSLNHLSMKQVNIFYKDEKRTIDVLGAECITQQINNFLRDSIRYNLKLLAAEKVIYNSADQTQKSVITNFKHQDNWVLAKEVQHTDKNFTLKLKDVAVYPVILGKDLVLMKTADTVRVKDVYIKGMFSHDTTNTAPAKALSIEHLEVSELFTDIIIGKQHLTTHGDHLLIQKFDVQKKMLPFDQVVGNLRHFYFRNKEIQCRLDSMQIDFNGNTHVHRPVFMAKDLRVDAENLQLRQNTDRNGTLTLGDIMVRKVRIEKPGKVILNSDSIQLLQSTFSQNQKPVINKILLYNNIVSLERKDSTSVNKFVLNPGELFRADQLGPVKTIHLNKTQVLVSGEKSADLKGIHISTKNNYILSSIDSIELHTPKMFILAANLSASYDHLKLRSLQVMPDMEAYEKQNKEADIMEINLSSISLFDQNDNNKAGLDILDIGEATMRIRKNKFLPDAAYSVKPFLIDPLLKGIAKTGLKEIRVHNGLLAYNELSDKTGKEARVELNAIEAILQNIQTPYSASMTGKARLYNNGVIDFNYQTIDSTQFELNAEVKKMNLTLLNNILMPLESVEIKSGQLQSLKLKMNGGDEKANGKTTITYKKLRLYIYDKKHPEKKTFKTSLISFLANVFVLRQHKRDATAGFEFAREKDASVFGYWIKGALTGAVKTLREGKKGKEKEKEKGKEKEKSASKR